MITMIKLSESQNKKKTDMSEKELYGEKAEQMGW